jgi:hypothetical protein
MREKNGRAKRYKESCGQFKHWKSPFPAHSKGTDNGSAFQCCFIALGKWFVAEEKRGAGDGPVLSFPWAASLQLPTLQRA